MAVLDTVYIDVMLFIYYFLYDPTLDDSQKALSFFRDIEDGRYIGVVSTFSINEYIGVVKKLVSEKQRRIITPDQVSLLKDVLLDFIRRMGIVLHDADNLTISPQTHTCSLFNESGILVETTNPFLGATDQQWHSLKGADSLHIIFAHRAKAEYFITNDDDFRGVNNNIKVMMLREKY